MRRIATPPRGSGRDAAMRAARSAVAASLVLVSLAAPPLAAQRTHALIVTGLGGEPRYSEAFTKQGAALHALAATQWRVADSSLVWLAEDPARDPRRIRARATKESIAEAFLALSRRVAPGDLLVVVLIGHGSGEGAGSRVNVAGADPTAADYATWLAGFTRQTVVVVNGASASGDFVPVLKGPGRIVVTATRTALERNESVFSEHFVRGLATAEADADKDGRTTVLEAFSYAVREVARVYREGNRLLTEHAVVSDSVLAARTAFAATAESADPRVAVLVAERRALEEEVAALRERKAGMPAERYEAELERLLLAIAERTAAIRALGERP
jgi:hypothetical protein